MYCYEREAINTNSVFLMGSPFYGFSFLWILNMQFSKSNLEFTNNNTKRFSVNRNIVMLLLAAVLGSAGVYLTNAFIQGKIAAYTAQFKQDESTIAVVVPRQNLPRGTRIVADDLATRQVPAQWVHQGVVTESNYTIAEGQRVSFDAEEGKPLLWAHLEGGSVPTFSGKLPKGMRALTVPVDEVNSLSGFLQPGDQVDLILTYKPGKNTITVPLLQDLTVLATGTTTAARNLLDGNNHGRTYRTVTVLVTPQDAKRVILAQETGSLTAVLRHPDDNQILPYKVTTVATLFGEPPKPKPKVRRVPKKKGVEFIIGGQ